MQSIRWGIIGCGDVTEKKSGPAFNKVANSNLVAAMRRDAAKAADYARRHNVPKWYADADELINDPDVDAIYIATPPSSHESLTIKALAKGKPVYVEKPMALNAAEGRNMAAASSKYDVPLCVAHYRRAVPMFVKIKQLIDSAAVGEVRVINLQMLAEAVPPKIAQTETNWRLDPALSGGGYFHDLAPHQLDLIYHWFGKPLTVNGFATNQAGLYVADDTVVGQMQLANGKIFSGSWCFCVDVGSAKEWCQITGSAGSIGFPFFGNQVILTKGGKETRFDFVHPEHIQQPMIEKVVQFFLGKGENPCPAEEAVAVMDMMDKMTASSSFLKMAFAI